jgi:hypothetical protein
MSRDPNITVTERVITAARRWLAIEDVVESGAKKGPER